MIFHDFRREKAFFSFDQKFQKFRNGDIMYGNFHERLPKKPEFVIEPCNRKFWIFGKRKIQWNGSSPVDRFAATYGRFHWTKKFSFLFPEISSGEGNIIFARDPPNFKKNFLSEISASFDIALCP